MTREDTSKLADGPYQAIRRLPTGRYELSASLQRPQPTHQDHQPPRIRGGLYAVFAHEPGWKVDRSLLVAIVVALIGMSGLAVLSIKMVGTAPELPPEIQSAAPVSPAEANSPDNNHAIEGRGRGEVSDSAPPTKVAKSASTLPREWLIESLAAAAQDPRLRKKAPTSPPSTGAAAIARVEVPIGSRSPNDTERSPGEAVDSAGKSATFGLGDPPTSESQSPPISRMRMDKRRIGAHHTTRRGTIRSARRKGGYGSYWDGYFQQWGFW
jgi:hypothetical protein